MDSKLDVLSNELPRLSNLGILPVVIQTMCGDSRPRYLTMGLLLGFSIGIIPKFSLIPLLLLLWLILSRSNLATGIFGAVLGTVIGWQSVDFLCEVGESALTKPILQSTFVDLQTLTFMPWLRFNNTLVAGSVICCVVCAIPAFVVVNFFFKRFRPMVVGKIKQTFFVATTVGH